MLGDDGFIKISAVLHCAVYALVRRGEVVYIGKSKKPLKRLTDHIYKQNSPIGNYNPYGAPTVKKYVVDDIWILGCMLGQLDDLERRMIQKYRPKYNVVHNPDKQANRGPVEIPQEIQAILATLAPELPPSRDTPVRQYIVRRL